MLDLGSSCVESSTQLRGLLIRMGQLGNATTAYVPPEVALRMWEGFSWAACSTEESRIASLALDVIRAAAARDTAAMRASGEAWFSLRAGNRDDDLKAMDEPALFNLLLAAVGEDDWGSVPVIESNHGRNVSSSQETANVRGLLLAMADE